MAASSSSNNAIPMDESFDFTHSFGKKIYDAVLDADSGVEPVVALMVGDAQRNSLRGYDYFSKCRKGKSDEEIKALWDEPTTDGEKLLKQLCIEVEKQLPENKKKKVKKSELTYPKNALVEETSFAKIEMKFLKSLVHTNTEKSGFMDIMKKYREGNDLKGRNTIKSETKLKKGVAASLHNLACVLWGLNPVSVVDMTNPKLLEYYNMENNKKLIYHSDTGLHSVDEEQLKNSIDAMSCSVDSARLSFTWLFNTLSKMISQNYHREERIRHFVRHSFLDFDSKNDTINNTTFVKGAAYVETMSRSIVRLINKGKITDDLNQLLENVCPSMAKNLIRKKGMDEVFEKRKFLQGYTYDDYCVYCLFEMNKYNCENSSSDLELKKELDSALRKMYKYFIGSIRRLRGNFKIDLEDRLKTNKQNPDDVKSLDNVFEHLMCIWEYTFKKAPNIFSDHEKSENFPHEVEETDLVSAFHLQIQRTGLNTFQKMRGNSLDWSIETLMHSLAGTSTLRSSYSGTSYTALSDNPLSATTKFYFYKNIMDIALEPVGPSVQCMRKMGNKACQLTTERLKAKEVVKNVSKKNKDVRFRIKHLCKWFEELKAPVVLSNEENELQLSGEELLLSGYYKPITCWKNDSVDFTLNRCIPLLQAVRNIVGVFYSHVKENKKWMKILRDGLKRANLSDDFLTHKTQGELLKEVVHHVLTTVSASGSSTPRTDSPKSTSTESTEEGSPVAVSATGKRKNRASQTKKSKSPKKKRKVTLPKYLGFDNAHNIEEICRYLDAYKMLFSVGASYLSDNGIPLSTSKEPILGWSTYLGSVWECLETTFAFNWNKETYDKGVSFHKVEGNFNSSAISDDPTLLIDAMKKAYLKVDSFEKGLKKTKKGQKYLPTPTIIASRLNNDMMFEKMKKLLKMEDFNALIRDFCEEYGDTSDVDENETAAPGKLSAL